MSYEGGQAAVYLFNIETGRQELLGDFPGMTFAPRFSRDGKSVLLTQADRPAIPTFTSWTCRPGSRAA
jgi:TolB protein